jgi:hypothetical protein
MIHTEVRRLYARVGVTPSDKFIGGCYTVEPMRVSKTIPCAKAQKRVSNYVLFGFSHNVLEFLRHANERIRLPILLAKKNKPQVFDARGFSLFATFYF